MKLSLTVACPACHAPVSHPCTANITSQRTRRGCRDAYLTCRDRTTKAMAHRALELAAQIRLVLA